MKRLGWSGSVGGLLVVLAILGVGYALLRDRAGETPTGVPVGDRMPDFAAPLVRGTLDGDVNLAIGDDQGTAGTRPACEVRGSQILNGCALAERGPVVLAFVARVGSCMTQLRALDRLRRAEPRLQVAAVAIKGDRDDLRRDLDRLRVRIPVGWDRDGALSGVYRVVVCPQVTFADRGGIVRSTAYGEMGFAELRRRAAALEGAR
jgi:hypothetical protein